MCEKQNLSFNVLKKLYIKVNENKSMLNYMENETIYIKDLSSSIKLRAEADVIMKINGVLKKEALVSVNDNIEFLINRVDAERKMNLEVEKDLMAAYLTCKYKNGVVYKLSDKKFKDELILEKGDSTILQYSKFTGNEVIGFLKSRSINFGIQYREMQELINGEKRVLIAKGIEAVQSTNDYLDIEFLNKESEVNHSKNVDYLEFNNITTIEEGEVLATIVKGTRGTEGRKITGVFINIREVGKIKLNLGEGVKLVGDKIIATRGGMPIYKKSNNKFEVKKIYELASDVNIKSGNVTFNGEVVIKGGVEENLKVYGAHGIRVAGDVKIAKLKSLGNISVYGKILQSEVQSGLLESQYTEKMKVLKDIENDLRSLKNDLSTIIKNNLLNGKKLGAIVRVLIDSKYSRIEDSYDFIKKDLEVIFAGKNELSRIFEKRIIRFAALNIKSLDEIDDILNIAQEYIAELNEIFALESNIEINYVQGSKITSKGTIYVKNQGMHISTLISDKDVLFENEKSIVRGGSIKAKKIIKCPIVGTSSGVTTILEVDNDGFIECNLAYYNTKFKIGNKILVLESNYKNIKVFIDKYDDITFEGLKV